MIIEYYRPQSLEEALELLARPGLTTVPLGGGTVVNQPSPEPVAVVDLQALGLNMIVETDVNYREKKNREVSNER